MITSCLCQPFASLAECLGFDDNNDNDNDNNDGILDTTTRNANSANTVCVEGEAMDVIIVINHNDNTKISSSDFIIRFPKMQRHTTGNMVESLDISRSFRNFMTNSKNNNKDDDKKVRIRLFNNNDNDNDDEDDDGAVMSTTANVDEPIYAFDDDDDNDDNGMMVYDFDKDLFVFNTNVEEEEEDEEEINNNATTNTTNTQFKPSQLLLNKLIKKLKPGKNQAQYELLMPNNNNNSNNSSNDNNTYPTGDSDDADDNNKKNDENDEMMIIRGKTKFNIYMWYTNDKVIVVDIDGTITKSNIRGLIDTIYTKKYDYVHGGVCSFFTNLLDKANNNNNKNNNNSFGSSSGGGGKVRTLYLTSRPLSISNSTRKFLMELRQKKSLKERRLSLQKSQHKQQKYYNYYSLPSGPLFCHPGNINEVIVSEVFTKDTHNHKYDMLFQQVTIPFIIASCVDNTNTNTITTTTTNHSSSNDINDDNDSYSKQQQQQQQIPMIATSSSIDSIELALHLSSYNDIKEVEIKNMIHNLFIAGFGNTTTDCLAYEMAGINKSHIFLIDKDSNIVCMDNNNNKNNNNNNNNNNASNRNLQEIRRNSNIMIDGSLHNNLSPNKKKKKQQQQHLQQQELLLEDNQQQQQRPMLDRKKSQYLSTLKGTQFKNGYNDPKLIDYIITNYYLPSTTTTTTTTTSIKEENDNNDNNINNINNTLSVEEEC